MTRTRWRGEKRENEKLRKKVTEISYLRNEKKMDSCARRSGGERKHEIEEERESVRLT